MPPIISTWQIYRDLRTRRLILVLGFSERGVLWRFLGHDLQEHESIDAFAAHAVIDISTRNPTPFTT